MKSFINILILVTAFGYCAAQSTNTTCYYCLDAGDGCHNDNFDEDLASTVSCGGSCVTSWSKVAGVFTASFRGCETADATCTDDGCTSISFFGVKSSTCKFCCDPSDGNDDCNKAGSVSSSLVLFTTMIGFLLVFVGKGL